VDAIQTQLTSVAVLLLAHLRVSHIGSQTLVNATSWATEEGGSLSIRVLCPLGTPISRWPPFYKVLVKVETTYLSLGLQNIGKGTAKMDCEQVLIHQILYLSKRGMISLAEVLTIWLQILGDATGVWQTLKMNDTAIVLKVASNTIFSYQLFLASVDVFVANAFVDADVDDACSYVDASA
jgi:hypothetical protein